MKKNNTNKKNILENIKTTLKSLTDKLFNGKKINKKIIIAIAILIAIIIIGKCTYQYFHERSTNSYDEIVKLIKEKDDLIIYYYSSDSKNENNKKVLGYLDKLGIKYYQYNDKYVSEEELNNFLQLVGIDKKLFDIPSIIYIKEGKMYGNLISIDSEKVVEQFINSYDLYTVK